MNNKGQQVIGHVLEALASILFTLTQEWKIYEVSATVSGEKRKAPEETWVIGAGTEIPCKYFLYGPVIHKTFIRNELRRKRLKNNDVFYYCISSWAYIWRNLY